MSSAQPSAAAPAADFVLDLPGPGLPPSPVPGDESFALTMARLAANPPEVCRPATSYAGQGGEALKADLTPALAAAGEVIIAVSPGDMHKPPLPDREESEDVCSRALICGALLAVLPPAAQPPGSVAQAEANSTLPALQTINALESTDASVPAHVRNEGPCVPADPPACGPAGCMGGSPLSSQPLAVQEPIMTNSCPTWDRNLHGMENLAQGRRDAALTQPTGSTAVASAHAFFTTDAGQTSAVSDAEAIPGRNDLNAALPGQAMEVRARQIAPQGAEGKWIERLAPPIESSRSVPVEPGLPAPSPGSSEANQVFEADSAQMSAGYHDGTFVAQQGKRMNRTGQTNKVAALDEQKLPATVSSDWATPKSAIEAGSSKVRDTLRSSRAKGKSAEPGVVDPATASLPAVGFLDRSSTVQSSNGVITSPVKSRELETLLVEQVVDLKLLGADTMEVWIRPDSRTELSLRLHLQDGAVQMHARIEQGDFAALNRQWSQLQQALSAQGIWLGPLRESPSAPPASNVGIAGSLPQPHPDADSRRQRPRVPESLDDLPLVGSVTEPLHRRRGRPAVVSSSRWETWA